MRVFAGRGAMLLTVMVLSAGTPARAELTNICDVSLGRTALALAALVYSHVPLVPPAGWADERWTEMRIRLAATGAGPGMEAGFREMTLEEGEFWLAQMLALPLPEADLALSLGTDAPGALTGGPLVGATWAQGLAQYTQADMLEALADVSPTAIAVVDSIARFTDAALLFALNLPWMLLNEKQFTWQTVVKKGQGLQDRLAPLRKKRGKEAQKALIQAHQRLAILERIARSTFKIVFGLVVGLGLWAIVRRF